MRSLERFRGDFDQPMNTEGFWWDKIIQVYERYDGANKMQIEQH